MGEVSVLVKKTHGRIYLIRNSVNGKGYVGQTTKKVYCRFNQHKYLAKSGFEGALHRAIRKYGAENFSVEEVVTSETKLLNDLEKHYIKFFGTHAVHGHGYNLTEGGEGGSEGKVWSEDSLRKLSERHKGNTYAKGYKHTDEAKTKMALALKSVKYQPPTEDAKRKIAATLKGHTVSEATRAKISAIQKGKKRPPMSEAAKVKLSEARKGKKLGPPMNNEIRAKIAASMKALRAAQRAIKHA